MAGNNDAASKCMHTNIEAIPLYMGIASVFVRIHFDAASLFSAIVFMTSIAVTLKRLRRLRRQYGVALEWVLCPNVRAFD